MPVLIMVLRVNSKLIHFDEKSFKNQKKIVFFRKRGVFLKKKNPAGLHHTEDRAGDAPKHPFSIKSIENQEKPNNQPPVNHKNYLLFLSLPGSWLRGNWLAAAGGTIEPQLEEPGWLR